MRSIARTSPVGLDRELVGAVAGADGDGQRVEPVSATKSLGLGRVGQQWSCESTPSAPWPSSCSPAVFERAEAAELAFDRHALGVGELHDFRVTLTLYS
jgi:hypothetical protein